MNMINGDMYNNYKVGAHIENYALLKKKPRPLYFMPLSLQDQVSLTYSPLRYHHHRNHQWTTIMTHLRDPNPFFH